MKNYRLMKKKIALILIITMLFSSFNSIALKNNVPASTFGLKEPIIEDDVSTWDCIYFGNYWQEDTNGDGIGTTDDEKQPIKWRVLSIDGNDAYLLSDKALTFAPINEELEWNPYGRFIKWEDSALNIWLNNTFLENAFSDTEQSDIIDSVSLLSGNDVINSKYGFNYTVLNWTDTRKCETTNYAETLYKKISNDNYLDKNRVGWWLKDESLFYDTTKLAPISLYQFVTYIGEVEQLGCVFYWKWGVRPAIHIDLSTANWSYAGKVRSDLGSTETSAEFDGTHNLNIKQGKSGYLKYSLCANSVEDLETLNSKIEWIVYDESVAKVISSTSINNIDYTTVEYEDRQYYINGIARIYGESAGTTTITAKIDEDKQFECEVNVEENVSHNNSSSDASASFEIPMASYDMEDESSFDKFAKFYPTNLNSETALIPLAIDKKTDKSGNNIFKVAIGIGKSNLLDDETSWLKYKDCIDDVNKYGNKTEKLYEVLNAFGTKNGFTVEESQLFSLDKMTSPKISLCGYLEAIYDKNGKRISSSGNVVLASNWKSSYSAQALLAGIPLYLDFGGGLSAKATLSTIPSSDLLKGGLEIDGFKGSLNITPNVYLEGGVGIAKVATVGGKGSLAIPIKGTIDTSDISNPNMTVDLSADLSIAVHVAFLFDESYSLLNNSFRIYPKEDKNKNVSSANNSLKVMSDNFANNTTKWSGKMKTLSENDPIVEQNDNCIKSSTLIDSVLPSTLPEQIAIGDKKVMLFQSYIDNEESALNNCRLMYSVYEDEKWSTPKPVYDNGCSDLYYKAKVVNNKLVLAWQKEKSLLEANENSSDVALKEMAEKSEICYAEFDYDTNSFVNQKYITNNEGCDMMPVICSNTDEVIISYITNSNNDMLQREGINTINYIKVDGSKAKNSERAHGTIENYETYYENGDIHSSYVTIENDLITVKDEKGILLNEECLYFAEDSNISSINYNDGNIVFVVDGDLYKWSTSNASMDSFKLNSSNFGSNLYLVANSDNEAYVWTAFDNETHTGSIVASMCDDGVYSEPIVLFEGENKQFEYLSVSKNSKNQWDIVARVYNTSTETTSIENIVLDETLDTELISANINQNDIKDGNTAIDFCINNKGDVGAKSIIVELKEGNDIIAKQDIFINTTPGSVICDTAYFDLGNITSAKDIKIYVYAKGEDNLDNSFVQLTAGQLDMEVDSCYVDNEDYITINAKVKNNSNNEGSAKVYLYDNPEKKNLLDQSKILTSSHRKKSKFCLK